MPVPRIYDGLGSAASRSRGRAPAAWSATVDAAQRAVASGPAGASYLRWLDRNGCVPRGDHGHEGGQLLSGRLTLDHPQHRHGRFLSALVGSLIGGRPVAAHSGMFPCFFGGSDSRFVRSSRSDRTTSARVSCGWITAST